MFSRSLALQCRLRPLINTGSRTSLYRRSLQSQAANLKQAFLEPARLNSEEHQGITCISLNRPETKNAISMRLLEVAYIL